MPVARTLQQQVVIILKERQSYFFICDDHGHTLGRMSDPEPSIIFLTNKEGELPVIWLEFDTNEHDGGFKIVARYEEWEKHAIDLAHLLEKYFGWMADRLKIITYSMSC